MHSGLITKFCLLLVIIGPYGIQGHLTGHSYQQNGVGVSKLIEDWKRFFPLHVVDDWTNVPEGIEHDIPVVVGVTVGGNFIKCPSHYVLVSLDDDGCEGEIDAREIRDIQGSIGQEIACNTYLVIGENLSKSGSTEL